MAGMDEAGFVERWLDAHPDFVADYVARCPAPVVLEYLLGTGAGVPASTTPALACTTSADGVAAWPGSGASRPGSGANTPARKISAQEFEKRGKTLSRMVTTVDGVPSFLAAGGSRDSADGGAPGNRASRRRNSELRTLDACELMNELILDICNDLDVTRLSHKILQNVCLLVDADRCSLFHVERRRDWVPADGGDERCLVSKLFNVSANSTVGECNAEEWRVPWGSGLVGYAAQTGCAVNIPDAYEVCRSRDELEMCGKAQRVARLTHALLDRSSPNFKRRSRVIGVLTRASMLRFSHRLWNVSPPNEGAKDSRQNSVTLATSLKRSWKFLLIMPTHICSCPKNLIKISPVYSEIIGLQETVKRWKNNIGRTWTLRHAMPER